MLRFKKSTSPLVAAVAVIVSALAQAQDGPGFPNIDYAPSESGSVLSLNDPGKAISAICMHRGYLFVPMGADGGGGRDRGAFALYDISDPTNVTTVFDSRDYPSTYHDSSSFDYVGDFAEEHHLPVSGDYALITERRNTSVGYCILDLSPLYDNPSDPKPRVVSRYSYPGITNASDYDGYSFAAGWQGSKYMWAPTGSNGLMIIDTSNFATPQLLTTIPRSQLANLTIRSVIPIGNLLVCTTASVGGNFQALILDISNPTSPQILNQFSGPMGYHPFVYGSKLYGGGSPLIAHDFSDPQNITSVTLNPNPGLDRPEYGFGKDEFIFIGHYPGLTKWRLDGTNTQEVERINSGLIDDHAFSTPLGNLAAVCSDHNNDRKLIIGIHDHEKDTRPPEVNFVSPSDGATNVHIKSRVGICLTDFVDTKSVTPSNFFIREFGGNPVPGTVSSMFGIVNFCPDNDLSPNQTYEVVLAANGLTDQAGNAIPAETLVATFSTGDTISTYDITVNTQTPQVTGSTINFSLSVDNPGGFSLEHSWDYGDGSPVTSFSSSTTSSHTYSTAGNHVVTVSTRLNGQTYTTKATSVQVIHNPIASTPPTNSSTIIFDGDNDLVWNVNPDNNSVSAIDANTLSLVYETNVGNNPKSIALAPGNKLWVTNKKSATISVIDRSTGNLFTTHFLPYASAPHAILIDNPNNTAYVTLEGKEQVAKLNASTGAIIGTIEVGPWPRALALDPSRNRLWVARFISPDESGRVTAINTSTFTISNTTSLPPVMEPDSLTNGRGLPNYLGTLSLSPDLTQAYVPAKKDNIFRGMLRDGKQLTFEHTVRSMATGINLNTGLENASSRIDFDNNDFATAAVYSPYGNQVFFSTNGSATIWVVDAYNPASSYTFATGGIAPDGLALSDDGSRLYVHNFMSRDVSVFNTAIACASICGAAPKLAQVSTVTSESLASNVLLGKQLFYNSDDPRLSQESYMSCSSCHLDGGHDGRVWDFTGMGEGLRNTIDLNGKGVGHGPLHWTANFDEVQDFEGQIRGLAGGSGLMSDTDFHTGTRSEPLGQGKSGISDDLDDLKAYIASLTGVGTSPHRQSNGELTPDAIAGREIFRSKNCARCHSGGSYTDSASLVRHDVGTLLSSSGQRLGGDLDGLDTPTLRGLWNGSPYLHDGSATTLKEVLTSKNLSGKHGDLFSLTDTEVNQLVAYLKQIDDHETSAPSAANNQAPTVSSPGAQSSSMHVAVSLPISASDPEDDTLYFSATGLPSGLSIDPDTGLITGSPTSHGEHNVTIGVKDTAGNADSTSFAWDIANIARDLSDIDPSMGPYRYVKLVATREVNNNAWTSIAEFNVLDSSGAPIDRSNWIASTDSQELSAENGAIGNAIDGNPGTIWHTEWAGSVDPPPPHEIVIDMISSHYVRGFRQLPRSNGVNGRIADYQFYASTNGSNWTLLSSGSFPNEFTEHEVLTSTATGSITYEWWSGFTGSSIDDLRSWASYPQSPTGSTTLSSAQASSDRDNNFAARMHGYLVPTKTGLYSFSIASDDSSELWLGTNHFASSATKIAMVSSFTEALEWEASAAQQSEPILLEAGKLYYISALHHDIGGSDHLAIAWKTPGSTSYQVIGGSYLMPYQQVSDNTPPAFNAPAYHFNIAENQAGGTVLGNVSATEVDAGQSIQYSIISGNTLGAFTINATTGQITTTMSLDFESTPLHQLLVQVTDNYSTPLSSSVPVTIHVGNVLENNDEVVFVELTKAGGPFQGHGNPALIGFNADPDGDGIPNSLELLRGTQPDVPDSPPGLRLGTTEHSGKTYMTYEIDVDASLDSALYFYFQNGNDLQNWDIPDNTPQLIGSNATYNTYRVRDNLPLDEAPRRFIKVSVSPLGGGEGSGLESQP
ncbi:cadherin domain-containing protein [Rubritalea halochordaticola]